LGITKNLMQLGGLQSLSRRVMLADGAIIFTSSVMGQDTIAITAATRPRLPESVRAKPTEVPSETATKAPSRQKKQREVRGAKWVRASDGPAKNGHRAIWDYAGNRMLVYSGWDRAATIIPAVAEQLETYEYPATGQVVRTNAFGNPFGFVWGTVTEPYTVGPDSWTFSAMAGANVYPDNGMSVGEVWVLESGPGTIADWYQAGEELWDGDPDLFPATRVVARLSYTQVELTPYIDYAPGGVAVWTRRYTTAPLFAKRIFDASGAFIGNSGFESPPHWEPTQLYLTPPGTLQPNYNDLANAANDAYISYSFELTPGTDNVNSVPDYRPAPLSGTGQFHLVDMRYSNELWQFTVDGGWAQLTNISENDWAAIIAANVEWVAADERSRFTQETETTLYLQDADGDTDTVLHETSGGTTRVSKLGEEFENELDVVFGGTTTEAGRYNNNASTGETWVYYYDALLGYEDDPDDVVV
jgi:hypothetical protein